MKKNVLACFILALFCVSLLCACRSTPDLPASVGKPVAENITAATEEQIETESTTSPTTESDSVCNHSWDNHWIPKFPNPYEAGLEKRSCSICEKVEERVIPKIEYTGASFYNPNNYLPETEKLGQVSWKPYCLWWQDGQLIAQCFVINDTNRDIRLEELTSIVLQYNGVTVGSAQNIPLKGDVIEANTYDIWQFGISDVQNYGSNLDPISYSFRVNYTSL